MNSVTSSPVTIQTSSESVPAVPLWCSVGVWTGS